MSPTVSYCFWLSLTVSPSAIKLLNVCNCLLLLLAVSHCFSGPMELVHVSHCFPLLLEVSYCIFFPM